MDDTAAKKSLAESILDAAIGLVPQWYQAECGPNQRTLSVDGVERRFFSQRGLTPQLRQFFEIIQNTLPEWSTLYASPIRPITRDALLDYYAIRWLRLHNAHVNWALLLRELESVTRRTFENQQVAKNFLIAAGT